MAGEDGPGAIYLLGPERARRPARP